MPKDVDFLIVGGGLAGNILALELLERGAKLLLIDMPMEGAASPVAAGLCNPISGKRLVREPEVGQKQAALISFAQKLEKLSGHSVLSEIPQTRFLNAEQISEVKKRHSNPAHEAHTQTNSNSSLTIDNTFRLDIPETCRLIEKLLQSKASRIETHFQYDKLTLGKGGARWREIDAKKVIFCEGWRGSQNPWFGELPFNLNKGQVLKLDHPNREPSLKNWGHWELQTGTERWLGATTERDYEHLNSDAEGRIALLESLASMQADSQTPHPQLLELKVLKQRAGIRPATIDRKPFIGIHPKYPHMGIFNGFGGKGSMLIPLAATTFADQLLRNQDCQHQTHLNQLLSK